MDTIEHPADTSGRLIAASKVNGTSVYNRAGEKLGSVYDVMVDKASGHSEYAIMSFGGFLGIGEKFHPLPWSTLAYDTTMGGYVVNLDRAQLEGAPVYDRADSGYWDDDTWSERVDDYYGSRTASDLHPGIGTRPTIGGGLPPRY